VKEPSPLAIVGGFCCALRLLLMVHSGCSSPFKKFVVLFVFGIGQSFKIISKSPRPTVIFRWAGSFSFEAKRELCAFLHRRVSLKCDFVTPAVAKVVLAGPFGLLA